MRVDAGKLLPTCRTLHAPSKATGPKRAFFRRQRISRNSRMFFIRHTLQTWSASMAGAEKSSIPSRDPRSSCVPGAPTAGPVRPTTSLYPRERRQARDIIRRMKAIKVAEAGFPTKFGAFRIFGFESPDKTENVLALV